MHLNYYFLKQLTEELNPIIANSELLECYSQNKDELIIALSNGTNEFFIKLIFNGSFSLLMFPKDPKRAKKNSIDLFPEVIGNSVLGISVFENERSFQISLKNKCSLVFKLHGNRSNILLFKNKKLISLFRNSLISDRSINIADLNRQINQSENAWLAQDFDIKSLFPTFGKRVNQYLHSRKFEQESNQKKTQILHETLQILNAQHYYIYQHQGLPYLTLIKENRTSNFESNSAIEACNYFGLSFISSYYLTREKKTILNVLNVQLKKCRAYITKSNKQLETIKSSIKHDEIANILMANIHLEKQNSNKIELFDFYRNKNIVIKLKENLSLQKNAEAYYRKGKNQQIEIDNLLKNIAIKEAKQKSLEISIDEVDQITELKELRAYKKGFENKAKSTVKAHVPYIEHELGGFKVLVGKNAKSNDILISKFASKNDLWLHARGVGGSHVIIKEKSGKNFPMEVIERAAQLAAWNSKGKNDTLCPVIYTPRKFIRKPKGALAGQVLVEKEEVILVKPCRNVQ